VSAYRLIAAERANHPISVMGRMLEVSSSGFYAGLSRPPSDRQLTDAWLLEKIKEIHEQHRRVYGAPRVHAELRMADGIRAGRKRVEAADGRAQSLRSDPQAPRANDDPRAGRPCG